MYLGKSEMFETCPYYVYSANVNTIITSKQPASLTNERYLCVLPQLGDASDLSNNTDTKILAINAISNR